MSDPVQHNLSKQRETILKGVLKHPWHRHILRVLTDGPARYVDIRRAIETTTGDPLGEGQLSATLNRLRKLNVVDKEYPEPTRPRWTLTSDGKVALRDLHYLELVQKSSPAEAGTDPQASVPAMAGSPCGAVRIFRDQGSRGASMQDREVQLPRIDPTVAHPARRYNYWLGGKDNFAADRASADEFEALVPELRQGVRASRDVLCRAVQYLAAERGIRQFLDIGSGLPTADNTHEVAQRVIPGAHVVYVDNDPLVMAHAQALLTSSPEGRTAYIEADLREPDTILDTITLHDLLDLTQPVALLLVAVLHFIPGRGAAKPIVERLVQAMAPGSYLVLTHSTGDFAPLEVVAAHEKMRREGRSDIWARSQEEIVDLFTGLEIIEPGIVPNTKWRPRPDTPDLPLHIVGTWAGVGYKR